MSIAITEEQLAIQGSLRDAIAGTRTTVRAMETDLTAWHVHWPDLATLGLFALTLPERLGGIGGTLLDQAAAVEQAAADLVPGPVLSTVLASLLLTDPQRRADLGGGHVTAAVALEPGTLTATSTNGDGGLLVSGVVEPVLGAHSHADLVLCARADDGRMVWFTVAPQPGVDVTPLTPLDFSRPLGRVTLDSLRVPGRQVLDLTSPTVLSRAATLAAAEAAGIALWCLDTAVDYAKVREQFGRPIGSFQAIKHLCAEMLCRAEQASALAWDAARAPTESLSAPAAAAIALDAAVDNAKDCIQVLGGIGFTWEHDAHLYLRRALANRQLLGGSARWRRQVADLAVAGVRRRLAVTADDEQARAGARALAEELTLLPAPDQRIRLAESGYLMPHWTRPYGLAASPRAQLVIDEELTRAGIQRPDLVIGAWAVPTILRHGTDAQRDRFVLSTLRGDLRWCQLFSEPGAGSDLASLRTKAVRADGGWRLTGQKVWTSEAVGADWGICLARTDPDAPQHAGITYFLVDMRSEGITLRPLREITGEARFNEVFLDDVFVPDDCVVGPVHGGWRLARTTLATERVAIGAGSTLGDGVERLLDIATERGLSEDDGIRERLGALVAQGLSVTLVDLRAMLRQLDGRGPGPESSVCKLVGVRQRQEVAEMALDLLGPAGAAVGTESSPQVHDFLLTRCLSIAGGTTQVLRNLVGERILGLPREGRS